jgi:hypothetical protein
MDRYWLLTWTTYGTWLPGDKRGFVSPVRTGAGSERRHNQPGTPYDADMPRLQSYGSRTLNRHWAKPASGTWWTQSGSTRKLPNESAVRAAIEYLRNQPHALLVWIMDGEYHRNTGEQGPLGP